MKPNFALNLSHEGISLLHRASGGWHLVDEVRLDDPEFQTKLAVMRKTATSLDPAGLTTKLVIPNSQILYRTVSAPGPGDGQRRDQIRAALDGATPYAVDDLIFDWDASGDQAFVAAVAKETLDEAEDFATEHKFNPVSFVALPEPGGFRGEPYFGMARSAEAVLNGAETVERDGEVIRILGPADVSKPNGGPAPAPAATSEPASTATDAPEPLAAPSFSSSFQSRRADKPGRTEPPVTSSAPARISFVPVGGPDDPTTPDMAPTSSEASAPRPDDAPAAPAKDAAPSTAAAPAKSAPRPEPALTRPAPPPVMPPPASSAGPALGPADATLSEGNAPGLTAVQSNGAVAAASAPVEAPSDVGGAPPIDQDVLDEDEARRFAEEQAMTVFGARQTGPTRGKPRFLGLILTVILLLFLAVVAVWSSYFVAGGVTGILPSNGIETAEDSEAAADAAAIELAVVDPGDAVAPIAPAAPADDTESVEIETPEPDSAEPQAVTEAEARAYYAATGVWQLPPTPPEVAPEGSIEDLYIASIDREITGHDAIALPDLDGGRVDRGLRPQQAPLPPGSVAAVGPDGRVLATPEGATAPSGVVIFAGRPDVVPPARPGRSATADAVDEAVRSAFADLRPRPRPGGLVESTERVRFGGRTLSELGTLRPKARPAAPQQEETVDEAPTVFAVARSLTPKSRPSDMAARVAAARARTPEPSSTEASTAAVAAAVPRRQAVTPAIPTRASVARRATVTNAINLRRLNLIGVYGTQSQRRALVRLPSGRYVKVSVGDRIDGGRVSAIGQSELRYTKGGRNITLKMPSG